MSYISHISVLATPVLQSPAPCPRQLSPFPFHGSARGQRARSEPCPRPGSGTSPAAEGGFPLAREALPGPRLTGSPGAASRTGRSCLPCSRQKELKEPKPLTWSTSSAIFQTASRARPRDFMARPLPLPFPPLPSPARGRAGAARARSAMARKRRASLRPAAAKKRRSGGLPKEEKEEQEEEEGECCREAVAGRSCATAAARAAPAAGSGAAVPARVGKDGTAGWRALVIGCVIGSVIGCGISAPDPGR